MSANPLRETKMNKTRLAVIVFVALVTLTSGAPSASATAYMFSAPVSAIQAALAAAIPGNTALYGFYDIYIRPGVAGDTTGGPLVSYTGSYTTGTPTSDVSPLPTGTDAWTGTTATFPLFTSYDPNAASWRFYASGTRLALVSTNTNLHGQTITNGSTPIGPLDNLANVSGVANFVMYLNATGLTLGTNYNFLITGYAYDFTSSAATAYNNKTTTFSASIELSAQAAPEPSTIFGIAGGAGMLALLAQRRRKLAQK